MKRIDVSLLVTIIICLAPLLFVKTGEGPRKRGTAGGEYVILITDEQTGDRVVLEKLSGAGITGVLSESSQWFFLNDFSGLRRVPLDQFSDVMLETDPRNDGYAQKLKTVFVRDGKRYFYIPRRALRSSNPSVITQRVSGALGGTPYQKIAFDASSASNGPLSNALVFAAASILCLLLAVYVSKPVLSGRGGRGGAVRDPAFPWLAAALLPASALFAGLGPAGFALTAVMFALFLTLRPSLKSFFTRTSSGRRDDFSGSGLAYMTRLLSGEKKALAVLFILFFAVCVTGGLDALHVLRAVLFFCLSAAVSVRREVASRAGGRHVRFFPVDIRPRAGVKVRLALAAFPFTLASAAAIVFSLAASPVAVDMSGKRGAPAISASEYKAHVDFQKTFAFKRLSRTGEGGNNGQYIRFETAPGGLLVPSEGGGPDEEEDTFTGIPDFPLESLAGFLGEKENDVFVPPVFDVRELAAVIISLALYFPCFFVAPKSYRTKDRNRLYIIERVSA
jgi:hypothetical protein